MSSAKKAKRDTHIYVNPSRAGSGIIPTDLFNTVPVDSLASCGASSSALHDFNTVIGRFLSSVKVNYK